MSKRKYVILQRQETFSRRGAILGLTHYGLIYVTSDVFCTDTAGHERIKNELISTKEELKDNPITSRLMDRLAVVSDDRLNVTLVSDLKKQKKQIKLPRDIAKYITFDKLDDHTSKVDFFTLLHSIITARYIDDFNNPKGWLSEVDPTEQFKRIKLLYK
ncbi:hypothetical protein, partial [Fructilactobacillus florum]